MQYVKCRWESSQMGPYDTEKKGTSDSDVQYTIGCYG